MSGVGRVVILWSRGSDLGVGQSSGVGDGAGEVGNVV